MDKLKVISFDKEAYRKLAMLNCNTKIPRPDK